MILVATAIATGLVFVSTLSYHAVASTLSRENWILLTPNLIGNGLFQQSIVMHNYKKIHHLDMVSKSLILTVIGTAALLLLITAPIVANHQTFAYKHGKYYYNGKYHNYPYHGKYYRYYYNPIIGKYYQKRHHVNNMHV